MCYYKIRIVLRGFRLPVSSLFIDSWIATGFCFREGRGERSVLLRLIASDPFLQLKVKEKLIRYHILFIIFQVGRSVDETLRLVQAFQYTDKHGEVCPAGWKPGKDTIIPDPKEKVKYFEKQAEKKSDL